MIEKIQQKALEYFSWIFLPILGVLCYFIKIQGIQNFTIYGDEAFSVFHAQKPLSDLLKVLLTDRNPPLFFIALHYWIKFFGIEVFWVKLLPSIFSILTSFTLYFFAKKHLNLLSAVFISISFLFSDVHFDQAHEIRAFSLVILLVVVSSFLFFELIQKKNWVYVSLLALTNILLLFAHYISFFFILAQGISAIFFMWSDRNLRKYMLSSFVLTALFYLPYAGVVMQNIPKAEEFWLQIPTFSDLKFVLEKLAEDVDLERFYWGITVVSFILILFSKKIQFFESLEWKKYMYLLFWFILPVMLCYGVAQFTPIFRLKYVLFSSPAWMLLVGYVISCVPASWWLKLVLMLPFFAWNMKHFHPEDRGIENWKQTVQLVQDLKKERTLTIITAGYKHLDFCYYYKPDYFKNYAKIVDLLKSDDIIEGYNSFHVENVDWTKYDQAILVQSHHLVVDPENTIEKYMNTRFSLCKRYGDSNSALVSLYTEKDKECGNMTLQKELAADSALCQWFNYALWTDQVGVQEVHKYTTDLEIANRSHCPRKTAFSNEIAYSGNISNKINKEAQFGLTLIQQVQGLEEFSAQCKVYPKDQLCDALFVVSLESNGTSVFRSETKLLNQAPNINAWNTVQIRIPIPVEKRDQYELRAYIWNERSCELYADDYAFSLTFPKKQTP